MVASSLLRSWATKDPWMKGKRTDMETQIHQGYDKGTWHSFGDVIYDNKISKYQLRDPDEEFAELYATWHVAKPKGEGLKDAHKKWFVKHKLHEDPAKDGDGK